MYLSRRELEAVALTAQNYGISTEDPELTARQAFEAIMLGEADEIAYRVTESAGVEWLTPTIWARKDRPHMQVDVAHEIIKQALKDETYEGETPGDDDKAIEVAQGLLEMAQDAWSQNIRGPEVAAIIGIAEEAGETTEGGVNGNGPKAKPKAAPKAASKGRPQRKAAEPEPEPDPEPEEDPRSSTAPWDGYDTDKVNDIIEGIEVWAEEGETDDITHVFLYEQAHKNRVRIVARIIELVPDLAPPDDAEDPQEPAEDPEPEAAAEPEEEPERKGAPVEPYEGYDGQKMSEIKESLEEFFSDEDTTAEGALDVIAQVFDYEALNKGRTTLMDYLSEKKKSYSQEENDGAEEPAAEEEGEGEAEGAAAPEADAGGKNAPARSKGGRKAAGSSSGTGSGSGSGSVGGSVYAVSADGTDDISVNSVNTAAAIAVALLSGGATQVSIVATDG